MDATGGFLGVIGSGLELAQSIVDRMNLKDHQKYIDRVRQVEIDLMAEDGKPDGTRSDRSLEDLQQLLSIETKTMNLAIAAGITALPK